MSVLDGGMSDQQEIYAVTDADPSNYGYETEPSISIASTSAPTEPPAAKRQRRRRKKKAQQQQPPTQEYNSPTLLKVPTPILVPSLPKSGTTSIHKYFLCGKQKSAYHVYRINGKVRNKIGKCVEQNIANANNNRRLPFDGCGDYDIWSDTKYVGAFHQQDHSSNSMATDVPCYYPFVEALEEIYTAYPQSTLLFITRKEEDWLKSIQTYHGGFIMDVWKRCRTGNYFPTGGMDATPSDFEACYEWHKQLIRNFAKDHPSMTHTEVPLEANTTGTLLEDQIGISETCWGHHNRHGKD